MARMRTAVLISGRGSNMTALIEAARDPSFPAEIVLVLANRPDAAGLARAAEAGLDTVAMDHKAFPDRASFERAMQGELQARRVELVCLAGFMRVLTPWFIDCWHGRLLNIHPSLLPAFRGLHTHERALAEGVRLHGCSVHFVVPELDAGPIVAQAAVPVLADDTPDTLGRRVLDVEHALYPMALGLVASGRVRLTEGRVAFEDVHGPAGTLMNPAPPASSAR